MSKPKTSLKEPTLDNRLLDDRGPTWELLQKVDYIQSDTGVISLRVQQSPIERAVARGTISKQHGRAADKFLSHWQRGGCIDLPTNWKAELSPGGNNKRDHLAKQDQHINDRDQLSIAINAIHRDMDRCGMSRDAISLISLIICNNMPFEHAGKNIWPEIGLTAAGTKAVLYITKALRVLTIEWGL